MASQLPPATTAANVGHQQQSRNLLITGGLGNAAPTTDLSGLIIASQSSSLSSSSGTGGGSLFGFSIRGGSEYRTGFFVSHVELGGEADGQGVQVRRMN